ATEIGAAAGGALGLEGAIGGGLTGAIAGAVSAAAGAQAAGAGAGQGCNDMALVTKQLQAARSMETYLNSQCAGGANPPSCPQQNMGWYHVVGSAEEARSTIN